MGKTPDINEAFCAVSKEDGHPEMYVGGKLVAEMNSPVAVRPGDPVKVEGDATVFRPNALPGKMVVDAKNEICTADIKGGAMFGMSEQKARFVAEPPKPGPKR